MNNDFGNFIRKSYLQVQIFLTKILGSASEGEWQSWELGHLGSNFNSVTNGLIAFEEVKHLQNELIVLFCSISILLIFVFSDSIL